MKYISGHHVVRARVDKTYIGKIRRNQGKVVCTCNIRLCDCVSVYELVCDGVCVVCVCMREKVGEKKK